MSWRPPPICKFCGQSVGEAHWQLFQHATCQPPSAEVTSGEEAADTMTRRVFSAHRTLVKVQREIQRWQGRDP